MPLSFWLFLIVCVVSFIPVIKSHGDLRRAIKHASGQDKRAKVMELCLLWTIPVITLIGTVVSGLEALTSGRENARLHQQASESEKRSKELDVQINETKLQLVKAEERLTELRTGSEPIDIGEQTSFAGALRSLGGIKVKLRCAMDPKAHNTAEALAAVFGWAGWDVVDRRFTGPVGKDGVVIGYSDNVNSQRAARLLLKELMARKVPCVLALPQECRGLTEDSIIVLVMQRPVSLAKTELMELEAEDALARLTEQELSWKRQELSEQQSAALAEIGSLLSRNFAPNSPEVVEAQARYSRLSVAISGTWGEALESTETRSSRFEKMSALRKAVRAEERRDLMGPGVHVFNSGAFDTNMVRIPPNSQIIIEKANLPRLE